jgi:hypothetical protein
MIIQNTLKIGDIITIGKHPRRVPQIVVRSERRIEPDGWWVDEIDTVALTTKQWRDANLPGAITGPRYNPIFNGSNIKSFYFLGSMHGKGTKIMDTDIEVIGTSVVKKEVVVTYSVTKIKSYG